MDEERCPECGKIKNAVNRIYCLNCGLFFNQSSETTTMEEEA